MAIAGAIRHERSRRRPTRRNMRRLYCAGFGRIWGGDVMADIERRAFVKGATLGALAFTVSGSTVMLTARQARAGNVPFRMLKENEAETIESMGETLVPGARGAGIAHFIDQQISVPPEQALLQLRILNAKPPFANFYRAAVRAIDGSSDKTLGRKFAML